MGLYEHWPYTNFHELNLNWILEEMKAMTEHIENYVAELGIKYADPIDWNITSQYEQNTLVIDPVSGTAYLSLKPVPSGISILNTEYWSPVFTLGELIRGIREGTAYAVEETNICTSPRAVGDLVWVDKTLVRCKQQILAGSAYNYGTGGNCERISVEILLDNLQSAITANAGSITELGSDIEGLQTTAEEHSQSIAALDTSMTAAQTAIAANTSSIDSNAQDIADIQGQIGSIIQNKKYVLIGDSYGQGYTPDGSVNGWCTIFRDRLGLNENNCIIITAGGTSFAHTGYKWSDLVLEQAEDGAVTDLILLGGYNDNPYTEEEIRAGMEAFKQACDVKYPNAAVYVGFVGRSTVNSQVSYNLYRCAGWYQKYCGWYNMKHLAGMKDALYDAYTMLSSDGYHPNQNGNNAIARALCNAYLGGDASVISNYSNLTLTPSNNWDSLNDNNLIGVTFADGVYHLTCRGRLTLTGQSHTITGNGDNWIELGNISDGYMCGDYYGRTVTTINMIIRSGSSYYHCDGALKIQDKKLYVSLSQTTDGHTNYESYSDFNQLQIMPFSADFPALYN